MNRQKVFLEMMETLIGKQINFEDIIGQSKDALEENCAKLSSEVGNPFEVNLDGEAKEPCPFCCSSMDKPFDLVWVGLNPGKPLKSCEGLFSWQNTTWQELVDFCVPTSDIRENEKNIYHHLKDSEYYKFLLRMHTALTTDKIYNTWDELKNNHADVEKFFVEHFAKYSILNADLVPYKSNTTTFNAKKLLDDESYGNYFRKLIQFIEQETKPDAWIIFYGARPEVQKLLNKFAPDWNVPDKNLYIKIDGHTKGNHFCLFNKGRRKILLAPFLISGQNTSPLYYNLNPLIDAMKELENK